ncbi:MAG: TonB-dependent receptor [Alistipes sp.]|nr:TonB-dependent receptor [Alistipes sp.]
MKRLFLITVILAVGILGAAAQVTTSSLGGVVADAAGNKLQGASVVARHLPSGSEYGVATDRNGRFSIQGMRTGGPYTVEISYIGYGTVEIRDVVLELGNMFEIAPVLKENNELDAVTVVSSAADRFNASKTGAASNYSAKTIADTPTVSRNIYDITRLSPLAQSPKFGGVSFGGANNRYNSFLIDGLANNDMYGLTSTGTNGGLTSANPVPLDALDEIQVVVAPFDVRQSGFTGGGINAVTKSGTNEFKGTAYVYYNNRDFYGTTAGKNVVGRTKLSEQSTQIYGATLGGAIVRDKLFFFLNGEFTLDNYPSSYYPGAGGAVSIAEAERIAARFKTLTGYDGGGYGQRNVDRTSGSLIARLDWNINGRNTLSVRYNFIDGRKDEYANTAMSFLFGGAGYTSVSRSHMIGAELNSRIGDNLHNELRIGYGNVTDGRETERLLPCVIIQGLGQSERATAYIGTDRYAGANSLDQHTVTVTDNLTWRTGNHAVTFGTHNEFYRSHVVYVANSLGTYTYNSLEDFENDRASVYTYNYTDETVTGSKTWGPTFNAVQFGLYVQDNWTPSMRFSLTYGLRADIPVIFGAPTVNERFNRSETAAKHGVRVGDVPRLQVLWSPRAGFRWYADSGRRTLIRGGAGLFTGRVPFVWIVNNYSNTGVEQKGITRRATTDEHGNIVVPAESFSVHPPTTDESTLNPSIQVLDKHFRYPQVFRANLAVEQTVGNGWHFMVEGLFGKTINNAVFENLTLSDDGQRIYAVDKASASAANTSIYYKADKSYSSIYYTTNTDRGYSYSVTASVVKSFRFGLDVAASYTFGHSYALCDATSSAQASNWGRTYAVNSDSPALSYSLFDSPHKLTAQVSYSRRYAKYFGSTLSLVYQMYSGARYSLCYGENVDLNGDGYSGNTLMYIPTKGELEKMSFADETSKEAWNDFIEKDAYLRSHRGRYSERNVFQTPMEHRLDLHFAQDFYFGAKTERKLQITLDIMNMGNMFDRDWGAYYSVSNSKLTPVRITALTDDGDGNKTPVYQFTGADYTRNDILSRWHMQLGVRVVF